MKNFLKINRALVAKKKVTLLFALLCASVMGWATEYCGEVISDVQSAGKTAELTCKKTGENTYLVQITSTADISGAYYNTAPLWMHINGTETYNVGAHFTRTGNTISATVTSSTVPDFYTNDFYFYYPGEVHFQLPISNIDFSATCAPSKPSPELSLNATAKTLEIDATAETFQINPTKASGSGAVSYLSNNESVVTVSSTGLVTAVGAGTTTITVSVAENDDYAADSKTLTVEVIDWPNIDWLQNGTNAYKLHVSPAIGGTQRIEGSNLWIGFPSAVFGAMSIEPSGGEGAWRTFALSNFPSYRGQFTVVWEGNTYTFTVYRNFDGVNLAKGMPSYTGHAALPAQGANDGNKGTRWGSEGAKHYSTEGDLAEDWWTVDLGAFYEVSSIKTLYEGATPKNYSFYTSPNNDSWIEIDSYNHTPKAGNTDADYNEYTYSPSKVARYVKIFAREAVQADFGYGVSIWEFEVYGQPAENVDVNAPVLASAAVSGTPTTTEIKIAVSATDVEDGVISLYRVRESSLKMDRNFTAVEGVLTFDGLLDNSDYSFTITALDNIGNQSNAIVVNASTAADPLHPATMAPEPPARSVDDVRAVYSDAYDDILAHDFRIGGQWGSAEGVRRVKNGNNYLLYDMSAKDWIALGVDGGGDDAIVAKDGYHGDAKTGLNASEMEELHIDVWSNVELAHINIYLENTKITTVAHDGTGWNQYNIELPSPMPDAAGNLRFMKMDGINDDNRAKIAVDNIYFFKAASGTKSVNVSVNNGLWGSATAKVGDDEVTSVATDTEVTFTATPSSSDYEFAYWLVGETKVYDNPYTLAITANTNAVATFEPTRTAYCAVPVTNAQGHTIYLTVKKTNNANEYMILFEGSSNTHITNSHGNIQFRLTHVNGTDGEYHFDGTKWTADATGFGSIYTTFTAADFRAITITNRYIPLTTSNSAADEFYFPTNDPTIIKWNATCTDDEAPVLAALVATPLSGTTVRLTLSATDNMAALLTYSIDYEGLATPIEVQGTAGETTYKNIKGLTTGTNYTFTVTVSDGTNTSAAQSCSATPTMPLAPVPTHNAALVRSVYSDAYESALAHDFIKNNWSWATYSEQSVGAEHWLVYTSDPAVQAQMPDVAWGTDNNGETAIIAKDGYNDGTNMGLDVRKMQYIHFDVWSAVATNYPELRLNDTPAGSFHLNGSGWQSFDLDISGLTDDQKTNIRWIKFIALRTPNPEEIAIDNVYFWSYGVTTNQAQGTDAGGWATFAAPIKLAVPSGLTAYKASYEKNETEEILNLTSIAVIPANEGVILKGTAGQNYLFAPTDAADPDMSGNVLVGCPVRTDVSSVRANNKDIFCMRYSGSYDMTGFFLYEGQYVPAGKAYLPLAKTGPSSAPRKIRFVINNEQAATDIEEVMGYGLPVTEKYIENGQLFIRRGEAVYTIEGVRVK